MKWSLCSTGYKEEPVESVLAFAHQLGFQGVELWDGHLLEFAQRYGSLDPLVQLLAEYRLSVPAVSGYTQFSKKAEPGEEELPQIAQICRSIQMAWQLGSPLVRTFAGHVPSRIADAREVAATVEDLRIAADEGRQLGVHIGLELHHNTFADTASAAKQLISQAAHPQLGFIFDGFNLYVEKQDQLQAIEELFPWTRHVHMKNYLWSWSDAVPSVPVPLFGGDIDNQALLHRLEEMGYDGFVSLEYFGEEGRKCVIQTMHELVK